jgi:capsule polysaccharide export protein KpsE/RkpR
MTTITISADVQASELGAIEAFLRDRNLIQAQAIKNLQAELAAKDAELQTVKAETEQQIQYMKDQLIEIERRMGRAAETEVPATEGDVE